MKNKKVLNIQKSLIFRKKFEVYKFFQKFIISLFYILLILNIITIILFGRVVFCYLIFYFVKASILKK